MKSIWSKVPIEFPDWLCNIWARLVWVLMCAPTTSARFWFGLVSIGFSSVLFTSINIHLSGSEYNLMLKLAPNWVWGLGFLIHGGSVIYGVATHSFNRLLVVLEGLLGTIVWTTSAVVVVVTQHTVGAHVVGALVAFWLLVRYPTHWEYKDAN